MSILDDKTEDAIRRAAEYHFLLREQMIKQKVTKERLLRLDDCPLTPIQVAYACKKYVIDLEKKRKAKRK